MVGVSGMADVATTAHILASGKPDEVIELANQNAAAADGPVDLAEEIRKAERQINEEREAARRKREEEEQAAEVEAQRLARFKGDVSYGAEQVSQAAGSAHTQAGFYHGPLETMPFGKFAGKPFAELPDWYLDWASNKVKVGRVKSSVEREMKRRNMQSAPAIEPQRRVLTKHGYDPDVSYGEAARIITEEINRRCRANQLRPNPH